MLIGHSLPQPGVVSSVNTMFIQLSQVMQGFQLGIGNGFDPLLARKFSLLAQAGRPTKLTDFSAPCLQLCKSSCQASNCLSKNTSRALRSAASLTCREVYLLLKLIQRFIHAELVISLSEFIMGKFTSINFLMQYGGGPFLIFLFCGLA